MLISFNTQSDAQQPTGGRTACRCSTLSPEPFKLWASKASKHAMPRIIWQEFWRRLLLVSQQRGDETNKKETPKMNGHGQGHWKRGSFLQRAVCAPHARCGMKMDKRDSTCPAMQRKQKTPTKIHLEVGCKLWLWWCMSVGLIHCTAPNFARAKQKMRRLCGKTNSAGEKGFDAMIWAAAPTRWRKPLPRKSKKQKRRPEGEINQINPGYSTECRAIYCQMCQWKLIFWIWSCP